MFSNCTAARIAKTTNTTKLQFGELINNFDN